MKYEYHHFSNGIRLVHRQQRGDIAHLGIIVNAGSRDEAPAEQGLAHFIEHLLFKGTQKRTNYQILSRLENVGADLNAFTTKEDTSIYASFGAAYLSRAAGLLSDIIFNSAFPEKEIAREKDVIIDELNSYKDNPAEWIHDEFDEKIFAGHPLGRNILGTAARLKKFTRADIAAFYNRHYVPSQMVISSVSHYPMSRMVGMVEKYFLRQGNDNQPLMREPFAGYQPFHHKRRYARHQSHALMGNIACSAYDENRIAMALLNNMLGGPAMSSMLNLLLREKNGIAYNIESNYQAFTDTGLFSIYCGTDDHNMPRAVELINRELTKLMKVSLPETKCHTAKRQLRGQLALSLESGQNEMLAMGKSMLIYGKVDSLAEISSKIDRITPALLLETANRFFDPSQMSMLLFDNA